MFGVSFYSSQSTVNRPSYLLELHMNEAGRLLNKQFQARVTTVVFNSENRPLRTRKNDKVFFLVPPLPPCQLGHWVCLVFTTYGVRILDSCASSGNHHNNYVEEMVRHHYRLPSSSVEIEESPQQTGDTACGYYAIANAVQLLSGLSVLHKYDQERMPAHLEQCFDEELFTPFPLSLLI